MPQEVAPKLFLPGGGELSVAEKIGGGGEARIYSMQGDAARVVKVYRKTDPIRARKLAAMLSAPPDDPWLKKRGQVSICWPQQAVLNESGDVAGFLMPRLDTAKHYPVGLLWNPEDRTACAPGFSWKYLCVAAANICSIVDLVHAKGHVIGDVNDENLLVSGSATATLVDCDSMQVRDPQSGATFRSPVTRDAFISPERLGVTLSEVDRSPYDDYWALAILIFGMLLEGQHPANGVGYPPERERRLRLGIFPLLGERSFSPPPYALSYTIVPPALRTLFDRCFREGHKQPDKRPTAADWKRALQLTSAGLTSCPASAAHVYSPHLASCPWCNERLASGIDRFARPVRAAAANQAVPVGAADNDTPSFVPAVARFLRALFN